jgi:hypothetical protein
LSTRVGRSRDPGYSALEISRRVFLPDELDRLLRRLRLPYVRRAAPEVIANATAQRWEHAEVLRVLLAEEAAGRD